MPFCLVFLFLNLLVLPIMAMQPENKALELNKEGIQKAYSDGEFEAAISEIIEFSKRQPIHSRDDSVFIAKYLGVMYASNPDTREKGKHHMFKLLELMPSAKIVDMFVSDEIDRIFERVKEEHEIKNLVLRKDMPENTKGQKNAQMDSTPNVQAGNRTTNSGSPNQKSKYWRVGGTVFLAASGTVAYLLIANYQSSKDKIYEVPR